MTLITNRPPNFTQTFKRPIKISEEDTRRISHRLMLYRTGTLKTVDIGIACLVKRERLGDTERFSFAIYFDDWFLGKAIIPDVEFERVRVEMLSICMDETTGTYPGINRWIYDERQYRSLWADS